MPPKKASTSTRRKVAPKKKPTRSKAASTTTSGGATLSSGRKSSATKRSRKSPLSATSPATTAANSGGVAGDTGGSLTPPLILPPSLSGRPLPTLILDSGGWTIKHDVLSPATTSCTNESTDLSNSNSSSSPNDAANTAASTSPKQSFNVIAKPKYALTSLISNEIDTIQNKSNLIVKRPLERGYTTDLGVQFQIWDYILALEHLECRHSFSNGGVHGGVLHPSSSSSQGGSTSAGKGGKGGGKRGSGEPHHHASGSSSRRVSPMPGGQPMIYTHTAAVVCLHQPFTPRNILEKEDEIFFRDFGFGRVHRILGVCCSAYQYLKLIKEEQQRQQQQQQQQIKTEENPETTKKKNDFGCSILENDETGCCCVIDSGFSLTHIVPTVDARAIVS